MKKYEKPEIKIVKFEVKDVIAASGWFPGFDLLPDIDGGETSFPEGWAQL